MHVAQATTTSMSHSGREVKSNVVWYSGKNVLMSPRLLTLLGFWILGMCFMFTNPSFMQVTEKQRQSYDGMVMKAINLEGYDQALLEYQLAEVQVEESKVWFWRFREPYRTNVLENTKVMQEKRKALQALDDKRDEIMAFARKTVGLWSEYGVEDARERFWKAFAFSKFFAQRHTFWQMLFRVMSGHENNAILFIFEWIFTAAINLTFALLGCLFYYIFSLGNMLLSYHPDPFSAAAFFGLAFMGALSVVSAYLIGLYGMIGGGVYVVGKVLLRNGRLQYEEQRRLREAHLHRE